jgi:response regulator NasT
MSSSATLRVLVAESDRGTRESLAAHLASLGHVVIAQVEDGQQAVYLVEELRPDLVLLEMDLPCLDGLRASQRIGQASLAPIILIGRQVDPPLLRLLGGAPAHAYLVKPVSEHLLAPAIEIALQRFRESQQLRDQLRCATQILDTSVVLKRARAYLSDRFGLAPRDAMQWIEQEARARRASLPEVASAILQEADVPYHHNVPI